MRQAVILLGGRLNDKNQRTADYVAIVRERSPFDLVASGWKIRFLDYIRIRFVACSELQSAFGFIGADRHYGSELGRVAKLNVDGRWRVLDRCIARWRRAGERCVRDYRYRCEH